MIGLMKKFAFYIILILIIISPIFRSQSAFSQPNISYEPTSFNEYDEFPHIITDSLYISNTGNDTLRYNITIEVEQPVDPVILASGGPDNFGHMWIDSDEPGGPAVDWIDISDIGIPINLTDNSFVGPMPIGFDFSYFDSSYSELYISSNGLISFGAGTEAFANANMPDTTSPNNIIAAWWDDLDPGAGGSIKYYSSTESMFIVSYENVPIKDHGGSLTFQVVLYNHGLVHLNYDAMNPGTGSLTTASIGTENVDGSDGLSILYDADYIHNWMTIEIRPPWLSVDHQEGVIFHSEVDTILVLVDPTFLDPPIGEGRIFIHSNDPEDSLILIPVLLHNIDPPPYFYLPGDINNDNTTNGIDIVYAVNFFKGIGPAPPRDCHPYCPMEPNPFYGAGDVNGNCAFNGVDITYFVRYLKMQVPTLLYCPECPPYNRVNGHH
jgi:hypothetical protein